MCPLGAFAHTENPNFADQMFPRATSMINLKRDEQRFWDGPRMKKTGGQGKPSASTSRNKRDCKSPRACKEYLRRASFVRSKSNKSPTL